MELADEVIALKFGSPELDALRDRARHGEPAALKSYVYFCAWRGICSDDYIPATAKASVFRKLVDADLISVALEENQSG